MDEFFVFRESVDSGCEGERAPCEGLEKEEEALKRGDGGVVN